MSIRLVIPRQVPIQQSSVRTCTSTSIFPEADKRCTKRMQLCNGLLRRHHYLQAIRKEHLEHLEEIFIRLKAAGLKLKLEKCCFFKRHIQYLGHLISADSIQPLPEKLESIAKMPAPKNPKEVKQFLGLVGYYRKFVPRFTDISRVLTHLTKKDVEFKWTPECEKLFPDIERIFTASTNTQIPQPSSQLHTLHRCIKICICRHTDAAQQWQRPPHHLCKWTISWITTKLGNTHERSLGTPPPKCHGNRSLLIVLFLLELQVVPHGTKGTDPKFVTRPVYMSP